MSSEIPWSQIAQYSGTLSLTPSPVDECYPHHHTLHLQIIIIPKLPRSSSLQRLCSISLSENVLTGTWLNNLTLPPLESLSIHADVKYDVAQILAFFLNRNSCPIRSLTVRSLDLTHLTGAANVLSPLESLITTGIYASSMHALQGLNLAVNAEFPEFRGTFDQV